MSFRIFISHSSPSEAAKQRLADIKAAIEDEAAAKNSKVHVIVDNGQIATGDDWRLRISYMLHVCHGAIVIIDDAAVASKWVLAEATFLSMRHRFDQDFRFIPVAVIDEAQLTDAKTKRRQLMSVLRDSDWDTVGLEDIQWAKGQTPRQIGERVIGGFAVSGSLTPRLTPIDRLANQLTAPLKVADEMSLQHLAAELGDDGIDYLSADVVVRGALTIARHMVRNPCLVDARARLDQFGVIYPDTNRRAIIRALCPLAFEPDMASLLTRRAESGRFIDAYLETGRPDFTIAQCILRAHLANNPPKLYTLQNVDHCVASLQDEIRNWWRAKNKDFAELSSDQAVDARLARLQCYVAVPGPLDVTVLDALRAAYPRLTFVIHQRPDDPATQLPPGVLPLVPPIGDERESEIYFDQVDALANLSREEIS